MRRTSTSLSRMSEGERPCTHSVAGECPTRSLPYHTLPAQAALEYHKDPTTLRFGAPKEHRDTPSLRSGCWQAGKQSRRAPSASLRGCFATLEVLQDPGTSIRDETPSPTPSASLLGPWNYTRTGRQTRPARRDNLNEAWPARMPVCPDVFPGHPSGVPGALQGLPGRNKGSHLLRFRGPEQRRDGLAGSSKPLACQFK